MMILGILSDTHGNQKLMLYAAQQMMHEHHAAQLLHLGDNYTDGEDLAAAGYPVQTVPGLWCEEYAACRVPKVLIEVYNGVCVACAHTGEDLLRGPGRLAPVQCVGHTHAARLEFSGGILQINPGHLKARRDRGQRASFALIQIGMDYVLAQIYELDGPLRREIRIERAQLIPASV